MGTTKSTKAAKAPRKTGRKIHDGKKKRANTGFIPVADSTGRFPCRLGCGKTFKHKSNEAEHSIMDKTKCCPLLPDIPCPKGCGMTLKSVDKHLLELCCLNINLKSVSTTRKRAECYQNLLRSLNFDPEISIKLWLGSTPNPLLSGLTYPQWFCLNILGMAVDDMLDLKDELYDFRLQENATACMSDKDIETAVGSLLDRDPNATETTATSVFISDGRTRNLTIEEQNRESEHKHGSKCPWDTATDTKCPGVNWRHGNIPCDTILSIKNCQSISKTVDGGFYWNQMCRPCASTAMKIHDRWIGRERVDELGIPLCGKGLCKKVAELPSMLCADHRAVSQTNAKANRNKNLLKRLLKKGPSKLYAGKPGSEIRTPEDAKLFLSKSKLVNCGSEWATLKKLASSQNKNTTRRIWIVDTEYSYLGEGITLLFEVAVMDLLSGEVVLNTKINHGKMIADLLPLDGVEGFHKEMAKASIAKVYGHSTISKVAHTTTTPGITIEELADKLRSIMTKKDMVVDWSTCFSDYWVLYKVLDGINATDAIPDKKNWFATINAWRKVVPGFLSFGLEFAYTTFCPDQPLKNAHRALPDAEMARNMVLLLLKYVRGFV